MPPKTGTNQYLDGVRQCSSSLWCLEIASNKDKMDGMAEASGRQFACSTTFHKRTAFPENKLHYEIGTDTKFRTLPFSIFSTCFLINFYASSGPNRIRLDKETDTLLRKRRLFIQFYSARRAWLLLAIMPWSRKKVSCDVVLFRWLSNHFRRRQQPGWLGIRVRKVTAVRHIFA